MPDLVNGLNDLYSAMDLLKEAADRIGLNVQVTLLAQDGAVITDKDVSAVRGRRYDWSTVDWSKTDAKIAEELGASRQAVNYQRNRHARPKAAGGNGRRQHPYRSWEYAPFQAQVMARVLETGPVSAKELADSLGIEWGDANQTSRIYGALQAMESKGAVRRGRKNGQLVYTPTRGWKKYGDPREVAAG